MEINDFISKFAGEFDETPTEKFIPETEFKKLEEWNSLTSLSIIAMVDDNYDKTITSADLRKCMTIKDLFDLVSSK